MRINLPRQTISLRTLTELYSNHFPARVIVDKQLGSLAQPQDSINVHFVKKRQTVRVVARNVVHLLPLNAALKIGLLHEVDNDFSCRSVFETVANIVVASPVPKVVCAKRQWRGGDNAADPQSFISAGEILAILDVITDPRGYKALRVYSYALKTAKLLPMECAGHFTLCPNEIKLSFSELLDNSAVSFPWSAVLFPESSAAVSRYPRELFDDVVNVTGCTETVSVVCTRFTAEANGAEIVELPVDTPLEIKCVCLSEEQTQTLKAHNIEVAERYDERSVRYLTGECESVAVPKGGLDAEKASPILDRLLCKECLDATSSGDKTGLSLRPQAAARPRHDSKSPSRSPDLSGVVQRHDAIAKDVASLREAVKSLQNHITGLAHVQRGVLNETEETNRRFLRELSIEQLLEVLEAMNLGMYKEVFREKQIDGMVFAELNEALMEHELEIKSKLHRLRLLMVAKGKRKANCK